MTTPNDIEPENYVLTAAPSIPEKYLGVKVFVRNVNETTIEGMITKYATGAYVELETELHHELIPWTSIVDIWVVKKREPEKAS